MKVKNKNLINIGLITVFWALAYLLTQIALEQKLGWDEVAYMSVAKGIANDFDFGARSYTIMGILKFGYPTHFINFPIFSIFLAIFFKLFGCSLKIAYFSSWLCALGVSILIYFIFLLLSKNSYKLALFLSIVYLFCPGILKTCDSAMMEQMGCLLLSLAVYFILKDYTNGVFNYLTVSKFVIFFLIIWLFKSLFLGFFFGALAFIFLAYNSNLSGKKISTKIPFFVFLLLSYGTFAILFYLVKKFIFLPVAPMMTFTQEIEIKQIYADFLGGFFNNLPTNIATNISSVFKYLILPYFIYPTVYTNPGSQFFSFIPHVVCIAVYFFLIFITMILTFAIWKKLSSEARVFAFLSLGTIFSFNIVFNFIFTTTYENIWRYNIYSLPLFLCYIGVVFKTSFEYIQAFVQEHPICFRSLLGLFFVFIYLPLFLSMLRIQLVLWDGYHNRAKYNDEIVKSVVGDQKPKFIYFNDGIHTTFTNYPIKQVMKDATNEQLTEVNMILPEAIEYLFLRPTDWLFKNNQDLILMGAPIINNKYNFLGVVKDTQVVVYKINK